MTLNGKKAVSMIALGEKSFGNAGREVGKKQF
jgi:hypothetical protein